MKEEIYCDIKKFIKNPITITIIFTTIVISIVFSIEGVDPNIRTLSITALLGGAGYFLTHYLEINRKQKEERLNHYRELASKIRVFVKGMENKRKLGIEFDEAYYTSWMTISSNAYEKLINYLESYIEWKKAKDEKKNNTEKLLNKLRENLKKFMKVIREEFITDRSVEFKDYDFRWKEKPDKQE